MLPPWKGDVLTASFLSSFLSLIWKSRKGSRKKRRVKGEKRRVKSTKRKSRLRDFSFCEGAIRKIFLLIFIWAWTLAQLFYNKLLFDRRRKASFSFLSSLLSLIWKSRKGSRKKREEWRVKSEEWRVQKEKAACATLKGRYFNRFFSLFSLISYLGKSREGFREKRKVKSEEWRVQKEKAACATFLFVKGR